MLHGWRASRSRHAGGLVVLGEQVAVSVVRERRDVAGRLAGFELVGLVVSVGRPGRRYRRGDVIAIEPREAIARGVVRVRDVVLVRAAAPFAGKLVRVVVRPDHAIVFLDDRGPVAQIVVRIIEAGKPYIRGRYVCEADPNKES